MAATLIAVAVIASRMMNREKDRSRLKATRRAMNAATFKQIGCTPGMCFAENNPSPVHG